MELFILAGLAVMAVVAELIDSSIGMMFGTILSPLLIILGFDPLVTVPAILFSQAIGGMVAAVKHHNYGHVNFNFHTQDFRAFLLIAGPGLVAVLFGAVMAISIPKLWLKAYIAVLVLIIGAMVLFRMKLKYSWKKMGVIGLVSSFNKALSGGGFGPFVTGGQIVIGKESKNSIGITTLSEVPICVSAFAIYFVLNGFSQWDFLLALSAGSFVGGAFGPTITNKSIEQKLKLAVGATVFVLGALLMLNLAGVFTVKGFGA